MGKPLQGFTFLAVVILFAAVSIKSTATLHAKGCAPPTMVAASVCKRPEYYRCQDAAPFALRASNLGAVEPLLCVCKGPNCNPATRVASHLESLIMSSALTVILICLLSQ
ncbi:unnamed protein product [Notodromas monacha]|uniref:Uncharacterized protein n=1 Tax=Notodromas monacha TaxID=399045 RepID=A0A7R9G8H8_9CRUS|nr:unnamed protein product [Notodromas monacha]CAG0913180.1 unnamed protein product [Notodromas monacha]